MKYNFVRTAAATPAIEVGDCRNNAKSIISLMKILAESNVELALFPELCLTSASCGDLFTQPFFIAQADACIREIADATKGCNTIFVIGAPVAHKEALYNCAVVIYNGHIIGATPNKRLSGTSNEPRWFTSGNALPCGCTTVIAGEEVPFVKEAIFTTPEYSFGIEIGDEAQAPVPTGALLAAQGAKIILNPAAAAELCGHNRLLKNGIGQQSGRCKCGYVHANSGWGESTSNAVHSGYSAIAECGDIIAEGERFATSSTFTITEIDCEKIRKMRLSDTSFQYSGNATEIHICQTANEDCNLHRSFSQQPFMPTSISREELFEEIFSIQASGLAKRIRHAHAQTCVIGISGGLDSTLALLVTAKAFDMLGKARKEIIAVTMPGFGTTDRTYNNAVCLMKSLGATVREISIREACIQHFKDIDHDIENHDITYENSQARERTQILMDIANQTNGLVVGTGDLSELALGWATYNGDHMSMYSVNASVPKTMMQHIVRHIAMTEADAKVRETLNDIVETPISPELIPAENNNIKQKTEDLVGPYELHDFFIYHFMHNGFSPEKIYFIAKNAFDGKYDDETIRKWLATFVRRFFIQQFKRSCMPDGPATGVCSLSPQNGWIMPADTNGNIWMQACKEL